MIEYAAASHHFEQAEHKCYLASVENNLGMLCFRINRCDEAHTYLDRARRIFISLKDIGLVAQVDEIRACVFLQQGRVAEAERVARLAVQNQEKTGRHALVAEAMIAHGRALARLERYGTSLSAFRRAFDLFEMTDNPNSAAEASRAAFQELGEHLAVIEGERLLPGRGLGQEKISIEHDAIKRALEQNKGSVTHAARDLGVSYPALKYMLRTRYKDLLKYRTPVRRRPRNRRRVLPCQTTNKIYNSSRLAPCVNSMTVCKHGSLPIKNAYCR